MHISGYRCMWIIVFFDLPTDTKKAKRQYTDFRKGLLEDGFAMMQYSVYYRHCASKENSTVHMDRIRKIVPPDGEVRLVQFTDKQFERMEVFLGKRRTKTEEAPAQLEMF
ncbi:MAG: CRISPR-associated endonuclease Cas2 [Verrucomicrobiaceae bacterium]